MNRYMNKQEKDFEHSNVVAAWHTMARLTRQAS